MLVGNTLAGAGFWIIEFKLQPPHGEAMPDEHATAIKLIANNTTGAIDPAARGRSQKDGVRLMDEYQQLGLKLVLANNEVESGLFRIQQLMSTQRLRIFDTCTGLLSELRQYQRDDNGKPTIDIAFYCEWFSATLCVATPTHEF